MRTYRAIGIALILIGVSLTIFQNYGVVLAVNNVYPTCDLPWYEKLSPTLSTTIQSMDGNVSVIVKLTAPSGTMAVMQQNVVVPQLIKVGFKVRKRITHIDNLVIGTISKDKLKDLASNPYVEKVLADVYIAKVFGDGNFTINLLKDSVPMIHADKVWAMGYTGQGVTVIIIDTGIDNDHPALMRNGKSLVIYEYHAYPTDKDYTLSHGTHCAGIIASQDETYRGVAYGIKGLIDILAFDESGYAKVSWLLDALDKAYSLADKYKPCVVSCSWGTVPSDSPECNELRKAVLKLVEKCPVVFAAGNFGPNSETIACPADADNDKNDVITVGAVDKSEYIAWFSSRGPDKWGNDHEEPDVVAPGVNIVSTLPNGKFGSMSGTSMACPHVTGVIALMLSKNPNLSNEECLKILTETAKDLGDPGFDYAYGYGLVQADKAVEAVKKEEFVVPKISSDYSYLGIALAIVGLIILIGGDVYIERLG